MKGDLIGRILSKGNERGYYRQNPNQRKLKGDIIGRILIKGNEMGYYRQNPNQRK